MSEIKEICKSISQAKPSKSLFIVLPDGKDYSGGIYKYFNKDLTLITDEQKTSYTMEVYPELISKDSIDIEELIRVGISWQYLSLKVESMGLGVSQRARAPKKYNKLVNKLINQNQAFLYSVAVRERDRGALVEDTLNPLQKEIEEDIVLLDTPACYKDRAIYENKYKGIPLDNAIFDRVEKKIPDFSNLHEISQLLWACQGENDHATHGNRDVLEKNGYGRVHASGCAGYAVYPIVYVEDLASLEKGAYLYNPVGYSGLNRWIEVNGKKNYDHFIWKFSSENNKTEIEKEFGIKLAHNAILLCIDRKKPCAGFMHRVMNLKYWAEIEAGMALAGLQLQANALGLKWQKAVLSNPDNPKYRTLFNLDSAEQTINKMASGLVNLAKNERLSLKGNLVPIALFHLL
jgi:nitroreductase